jgi:hypothetical protein
MKTGTESEDGAGRQNPEASQGTMDTALSLSGFLVGEAEALGDGGDVQCSVDDAGDDDEHSQPTEHKL